jgi:hypothetical protein
MEELKDLEVKTEIANYEYVTVDGKVPDEPISLFATRRFQVSAVASAFFIGFLAYWFIIPHP